MRTFEFLGLKLCLNDEVYEPAEDTALLMELIQVRPGESVLEVGSGTGVLGVRAAMLGGRVTMIDVNPQAAEASLCSSRLNKVDVNVLNCDLLTCLRKFKVDVGIFNPPYLPLRNILRGYITVGLVVKLGTMFLLSSFRV